MKVYAVIEEYDPYVNYPDIESRAELKILAVYMKQKDAQDCRNEYVKAEAEEYDIDIPERDYADPEKTISILGSEYYIQEFDVQ